MSTQAATFTQEAAKPETGRSIRPVIHAACNALIAAERELTELDRITGDGDLGISMKRTAEAVRDSIIADPLDDVPATLKALGHTLRRELGGSSGPLYGVLFLRCGNVLESSGASSMRAWADALDQGCRALAELGGAKPGDRTMLDALAPFVESLKASEAAPPSPLQDALLAAVEAAEHGAEATARMQPRLGRSSYLGERVLGYPDPGAKAVAIWLRAAIHALILD